MDICFFECSFFSKFFLKTKNLEGDLMNIHENVTDNIFSKSYIFIFHINQFEYDKSS